jgi:hypothetical protein
MAETIDGREMTWAEIYRLIREGNVVTGFMGMAIPEDLAREQAGREERGELASQQ